MSLMNRRSEYSWGPTSLSDLKLIPESREYKLDESVKIHLGFRIIGGLRESFIPDVWTVAWEDNDKLARLVMTASLRKAGSLGKVLATTGKEVRRGKFYWSRDPDLPYRIWAAIIHEDGSAPIIPSSVEDAKSKYLDVEKTFEIPASTLGRGASKLSASVDISWGRRSYLEKGRASGKTGTTQIKIV
ncbi:MAG: hypothetical protein OK449_04900 [Thaumarchaeota archaeon]|nr:hypothetical protein [Nitrososphaerota archaeon]